MATKAKEPEPGAQLRKPRGAPKGHPPWNRKAPEHIDHIVHVEAPWNAKIGTKWEGEGQEDYEVIKMIQVISYPTGMYRYEQMWSGFWKRDSADLVKWSLTHHEACGNTFKQARIAGGKADYVHFSYFEGHGEGGTEVAIPEGAVFYEELPLQLRLLVHSGLKDPVTIPLFPTVIHAKSDPMQPTSATIRQTRRGKGEIEFEVAHSGGTDRLVYETKTPYKLLRWEMADGSSLSLRKWLFTDYWNRNQPGDEKLLK